MDIFVSHCPFQQLWWIHNQTSEVELHVILQLDKGRSVKIYLALLSVDLPEVEPAFFRRVTKYIWRGVPSGTGVIRWLVSIQSLHTHTISRKRACGLKENSSNPQGVLFYWYLGSIKACLTSVTKSHRQVSSLWLKKSRWFRQSQETIQHILSMWLGNLSKAWGKYRLFSNQLHKSSSMSHR